SLEELDLAMEQGASKFAVSECNWPSEFPYTPDCNGAVARSRTHLAVIYHVRGLDLRAFALEDNGKSWEDSCCEFFIADPSDGTYYNFELTCIGSLLAAKRKSRQECTHFKPSDMERIIRHSSLEHRPWDESGQIFGWTVAMLIPFDLIGLDGASLPETLRGNFYKCGDLTAHPHFLSWNPVGTPNPDFHRPEFFGEFLPC
ncbi:MAG: hypothetical protein IK076_07865, partial [Bacteroidales bacterium]|nr:hypothetical protein [Bacteroidales bacterium]